MSDTHFATPDATPEPAKRACRILLIEDNLDAAESLVELLVMLEHEVDVAYTARDGIEKARVFQPDLVLCDVGLPDMDGYEVAHEMRQDPTLHETTLVALTGYTRPEDIAHAKEAGFDQHLAKPVKLAQLEPLIAACKRR